MTRGFSLVELSIVLVILGLLTGGILAGQSLIRAAELRSVSTEYNRYVAASQTFRDKYFAIPGDIANATSFWGKDSAACPAHTGTAATPGTCNGNGDGLVDITTSAPGSAPSESFAYFQHLAFAGLVEGTYTGLSGAGGAQDAIIGTNVPRSRVNNAGWTAYFLNDAPAANLTVFEGNYGNIYFFGRQLAGTSTWGDTLKPEEAWNIDTKMDDGKPGTGKARVREDVVNCHDAGMTASPAAGTANYDLDRNSSACSFIFNM